MRILIIGGVAGGATAAAKARRESEQAEIIIFERGEYLSFANCGLPYHIGGEIQEREKLVLKSPEDFWNQYRIQAKTLHCVTAIDRQKKCITVRNLKTGSDNEEPYDKLILSQGAEPVKPPFPGVDLPHVFKLRDIPDMDRIIARVQSKEVQNIVVVGGGFIGLETAENFHHLGKSVCVVERLPQILPQIDPDLAAEVASRIERDRFKVMTSETVVGIDETSVQLESGKSLKAECVLLAVGVKPETELAKGAGLEIGDTGGVVTNEYMQTSDPDIYAVGDMVETKNLVSGKPFRIPLAGPANRQGRIAGANAVGASMRYAGALGTSVLKVFDVQIASTGLNTRSATEAGLDFESSLTQHSNHVGYYPGAAAIRTKIIIEKSTGRLLGAMSLGGEGTPRRIDVLATAIKGQMSVEDLEELDLCYSPPFGAANDPVNMAGFVGGHIYRQDAPSLSPEGLDWQAYYILDVRPEAAVRATGKIANSHNIPLFELRDRLEEVPNDKDILVHCMSGHTSYMAQRALMGQGFTKVFNLRGGFLHAKWTNAPVE